LDEELRVFEARRADLLGRARGQYALVKGDRVVDTFVSLEDALKHGYAEFGNQPFLVKQVIETDVPLEFASFNVAV